MSTTNSNGDGTRPSDRHSLSRVGPAMSCGPFRSRFAHYSIIAVLLSFLLTNISFAAVLDQPMTGAAAPGWVIGGSAYLTASTGVDPAGDGWLRLTDVANNQAGFGFYDSAFDISQGVVIQFDYATWGGNGADGYSVYLFDGSYDASTFSVGASGGSLGYAQKTVAPFDPGLTGGYIGIGIDEYGNFGNATEGRVGGYGFHVNEVGVRGPTANDPTGVTGYAWLGGSNTLAQNLAFNNQGYRPIQTNTQYRKVVIYLTPVAAPNYLRIDVYVQFGFNQSLTPVVTGLYTGQPIPASVKIGYAASTGGSTNYHEIRNLVVNPLQTDINLAMVKLASSPTVTQGGPLTYTLTAHNYGPNPITATNAPITDTIPAFLTGATWTCAGSGGATCGAASGSGNINTTATLPFNTSVNYTITSTVSTTAPIGTLITNTATISMPTGTDYNPSDNSSSVDVSVTGPPVTVSGMVYNDANHNGAQDGGENSTNVAGIYAKLFRTGDLSNAVSVVAVTQASGAFSFVNVPSYQNYTIILSNNNTPTDPTPAFPSGQWIYTVPLNYTLANIAVGGTNVTGLLLGLYQGSRIDGKVIKDDGFNGATANANDGILNAAETGIAGVTVSLTDNAGGTTYDSVTTGPSGTFSLYTNLTSRTLRIYETNLPNYLSVNFNAGTTGGAYTIGGEYIQFAYTQYTDYTGVLFGDVPDNTFTPASRAQSGNALSPIFYAHTFTPGSGGTVSFGTASRTQGSWPAAVYYNDASCNGTYDAGTDTVISGALTAYAGTPICVLAEVTIPISATNGSSDALVTRATFTFTNSIGPVVTTHDVTDTTTVLAPDLSTSTKTWTDLNGGDQNPNDAIRYTVTLINTSSAIASGVTVTDLLPSTLTSPTIVTCPSTSCSVAGQLLTAATVTVPGNSSVAFVFDTAIAGVAPGTLIDNTAHITNPSGPGAAPAASTIIVSGSAIPQWGNKPLYLYDNTSTPAYKLSRTKPAGLAGTVTLAKGGGTQVWLLNPALRSGVTTSGATVAVNLWLASNSAIQTRTIEVRLSCASAPGTFATSGNITLNAPAQITTTPLLATFSLTGNLPMTCAATDSWRLDVFNQTAGGGARNVIVYPMSGTNNSYVDLPARNVINVDSVISYSTVYAGVTIPSYFLAGSTVYLRAVVSDPFGSYDINANPPATLPKLTLKDPAGSIILNAVNVPQVADSGTLTRTFEYAYGPLPVTGPSGTWTATVTATEGTEGTVSDFGIGTFRLVLMPSITMLKTAQTYSDPYNDLTNPKSIPGAIMLYTITTVNTGLGTADTMTITDPIPANTELYVGNIAGAGSGPVLFTDGPSLSPAAPSSGLVYTFSGLGSGADSISFSSTGGAPYNYTPVPDANGFDANVKGIQIAPAGSFSASDGINNPAFSLKFRVRIK